MSGGPREPESKRMLRLHMDAAAQHGDRSLPALILQLAGDHGLLDVLTFIEARDGAQEGPDQSLVIEIRDDEFRLRSFASSLANLSGIGLATLEPGETLFRLAGWEP